MSSSEPVDDGSGGGSTDDSIDLSAPGSKSIILPDWLTSIKSVLVAFGNSPAGFILGVASSMVLGGLETIVTTLLDAVVILFTGSGPGLQGTLGIADLPLLLGSQLTAVGSWIGTGTATTPGLIDVAESGTTALIELTSSFGPLAPIVLALIVSALGIVVAWVTRNVLEVLVDFIPGGGAFLQ